MYGLYSAEVGSFNANFLKSFNHNLVVKFGLFLHILRLSYGFCLSVC